MSRFKNRRKNLFIEDKRAENEQEEMRKNVSHESNDISSRMKFNFSYFNPESPGYDFNNLKKEELADFCTKLRVFSREPLTHWMQQPVGKGSGHVYENYVNYPTHSDFDNPEHVPKGVEWGRFRMDYETRLVGFIAPRECNGKRISLKGKDYYLECNVFYAVFLDMDHRFYLTKKK